jgi:signal peptidase I
MLPTIKIGDRMFMSKIFSADKLKYGDIVVFYPPFNKNHSSLFIKRVVGVEGDKIEVKDGYLYINDKKKIEPFIKEKPNYKFGPIIVPEGKLFVMGDNRNHSFDSHEWGNLYLDKKDVIGVAGFRYFPFSSFGKVE